MYQTVRRRLRRAALAGITVVAASASAAHAVPITGEAVVTRPYVFTLEGVDIYLLGVDSVELNQTCQIDRRNWDCWAAAQRQLETILAEGVVMCETVVGPGTASRAIALCTVNGEDVGLRFVASGFATTIPDETTRYQEALEAAREAEIGLWQSEFLPPAIWRSRPFSLRSERPNYPYGPMD